MCLAAKGILERNMPKGFKMVLQKSEMEVAQLFTIDMHGDENEEEHVVVPCSSWPQMYVYFDESEPDQSIQIVLIDDSEVSESLVPSTS